MRAPIGLRIRNLRKAKGLSQSGLAKSVGISPTYLNLIEANKRDVGGTLVQKLAAELHVELHELTGETEQRLLGELQEAFSDPILESLRLDERAAHSAVAQMPELARALHLAYRAYLDAAASANAYSHRLESDPMFSELLHQMLSRITAVRSAAEILEDVPDVDETSRQAFYSTITRESRDLSASARALIGEFDRDVRSHRSISPAREINDLLIEERNYFPSLEEAGAEVLAEFGGGTPPSVERLTEALDQQFDISVAFNETPPANVPAHRRYGFDAANRTQWFRPGLPVATIRFQLALRYVLIAAGDLISDLTLDERLTSHQARELAIQALAAYLAGAVLFPYSRFYEQAESSRYDLDFLAQHYSASFEQIAHRLVTLRKPGEEGIPFGFLRADPAGYLSKQFPLPGLVMPGAGHACPLWVLYGAFRNSGVLSRQTVSFSDGSRYLFVAKATAKRVSSFGEQPVLSSAMLACDLLHADRTIYAQGLDLADEQADVPVGPSCRLCVRQACAHRQQQVAANIAR